MSFVSCLDGFLLSVVYDVSTILQYCTDQHDRIITPLCTYTYQTTVVLRGSMYLYKYSMYVCMTSLPLSTTVLQTTKYYKTEEQIQYRVSRLLQWTGQQGEEIEMKWAWREERAA